MARVLESNTQIIANKTSWTDAAKRRKMIRAAKFFMRREPEWLDLPVRFDVLAVQGLPTGVHRVDWVKDAFRAVT